MAVMKTRQALAATALLFFYSLTVNLLSLPPAPNLNQDGDTPTYMGWYGQIKEGIVPHLGHRTPTYPLVIAATEIFTSPAHVIYLQALLGAVAAAVFFAWFLLPSVGSLPGALLLAAFCVSDYGVTSWHGMVLTESLSSSLVLLWMTAAYSLRHRLAFALEVALLFLRPSFLLFAAIRGRRSFLALMALVMAYMGLNYAQNGRFELSDVGPMGRLGNLMRVALTDPQTCRQTPCGEITREALKIYAKNHYEDDAWIFRWRLMRAFPGRPWHPMMDELVQDLTPGHRLALLKMGFGRFSGLFNNWWIYQREGRVLKIFPGFWDLASRYQDLVQKLGKLALLWAAALTIVSLWRRKGTPWHRALPLYAWMYIALISIMGTYDEWFRMLTPVRMLLHLMIGQMVMDVLKTLSLASGLLRGSGPRPMQRARQTPASTR